MLDLLRKLLTFLGRVLGGGNIMVFKDQLITGAGLADGGRESQGQLKPW